MKKLIYLFLASLLLVFLCSCGKESPAEDFEYEMEDGEVIITNYVGSELEIYIPAEINDRPVTVIGESAFEEYDMTFVYIPDSVTKIESGAFRYCACLTDVRFSRNLTEIGYGAFSECTELTEVSLPDKLENIDMYTFSDCESLEKIELPNSLISIEDEAFCGCTSLSDVEFPVGLEYIGNNSFEGCTSLSNVELPVGLEYLCDDSFEGCDSLDELKIPFNAIADIKVEYLYNADGILFRLNVSSPVGGYTIDYLNNSGSIQQMHTTLVVEKDSYAYEAVEEIGESVLAEHGITVKVK